MTLDSNSIIDTEEARDAAVEAFKRAHLTPTIRETMALFGMTEAEYIARLKAWLFPHPIITWSSGTNAHQRLHDPQ